MDFNYTTQQDEDAYRSLASLVKNNNGFFKSAKQSALFMSGKVKYLWTRQFDKYDPVVNVHSMAKYFGIVVEPTDEVMVIDAMMRWANYGAKSWRPVTWIFVIDKFGVKAEYKLGYIGDMRAGTSVDTKKTTRLFVRDYSLPLPVDMFAAEEQAKKEQAARSATMQYVGKVGERSEFIATVKMTRPFESHFGNGMMTVLEDPQGNKIVYWNALGDVGDTVKFRATVKKHEEYKGVKQTTIQRAKVIA